MGNYLKNYPYNHSIDLINSRLYAVTKKSEKEYNSKRLKAIFSMLDLTSLNSTDNDEHIINICKKINQFKNEFPKIPEIAAFCIYPNFVEVARKHINTEINIAAVSACFPSSQSFLDVKLEEIKKTVEAGADEIDIVMNIGDYLAKNHEKIVDEIKQIKNICGDVHLKVILEVDLLPYDSDVYSASILAIHAGADFIKTSTGKEGSIAHPKAVMIMAMAIRDFYEKTEKMIGIKPAGGIKTGADAMIYYSIVKEILGDDWLNSKFFRFGASSLANNLIKEIIDIDGGIYEKYW